jgi:hypothetical protein
MSNLILKENSKLASKIHSIEEFMERNNLRIVISKMKNKPDILLTDGKRYFIFINKQQQRVSEFPPRQLGSYHLCDEFGSVQQSNTENHGKTKQQPEQQPEQPKQEFETETIDRKGT